MAISWTYTLRQSLTPSACRVLERTEVDGWTRGVSFNRVHEWRVTSNLATPPSERLPFVCMAVVSGKAMASDLQASRWYIV